MKKLSLMGAALMVLAFAVVQVAAQQGYQKPPQEIMDVLNAPSLPATSLSPTKDTIALLEPLRYPPIAELAQPMLRLAGLRINPNANSQHRQLYFVKVTLKNVADGKETPVVLPPNAQIIAPAWSADGAYLAAGNLTPNGVELWIIETATAKAKRLNGVQVNTAYGGGFSWMPDQRTLLVNAVPKQRGAAPGYQNLTPAGPNIQEGTGNGGAVQTFQDLLKSPNDEALFTYYATSQLVAVGVNGKTKDIGAPAIFDEASVSPDGKYILTARIHTPYSYLYPASRFPKDVAVWDMDGKIVYQAAQLPLQDKLPVQGVPTGVRAEDWQPTQPATLVWVEALDEGNPKNKATHRDKIMALPAPFTAAPTEIVKLEQRYQGRVFGEKDGLFLYYDYNRDKQRRRVPTWSSNPCGPGC